MATTEELPAYSPPYNNNASTSVFATSSRPVLDIPLNVLNRPFQPVLDEAKVQKFMGDLKAGHLFTPIEVLKCDLPDGRKYYFSFGGCHRFEANKRLGSATIRGTIISVPPSTIRSHLGASCPF